MSRIKKFLILVLLTAVAVISYDYWKFHSMRQSALELIVKCNGRAGSILGWPLGQDFVVSFNQPLTESQIEQLSQLNEYKYRSSFLIYLNYDIDDSELIQIRKKTGLRIAPGKSKNNP